MGGFKKLVNIKILILKNLWFISSLHIFSPSIFEILLWNLILQRSINGPVIHLIPAIYVHRVIIHSVLILCNWSCINELNCLEILGYFYMNTIISNHAWMICFIVFFKNGTLSTCFFLSKLFKFVTYWLVFTVNIRVNELYIPIRLLLSLLYPLKEVHMIHNLFVCDRCVIFKHFIDKSALSFMSFQQHLCWWRNMSNHRRQRRVWFWCEN